MFFGVAAALILKDFPFAIFLVAGTPESFVVFTPVTFTVTTTFLLPDLTVIFAVPAFFALITPLELTVATFLFEEEYVTFSDPYYKASQRLVTLADDTAFDDCKDAASVEEVLKGLSASDKIGGQQGTTAQYFVEGSDDWGFEGLPAEWVPYKSASLAVQDMINGNVKYVIIDAAPAESITKAINAMQ